MVFWSVLPPEMSGLGVPSPETSHYKEVIYDGISLLVEELPDRRCRIERILSTDPADFLAVDLQPGDMLHVEKLGIEKFI